MKKNIVTIILVVATGTMLAQISTPFVSWDYLIERSPEIVIARCTATPQRTGTINSVTESDIEIVSILKGSTKPRLSHMQSWYLPHQGEQFLMFANFYTDKGYTAVESYQIIPLNRDFQTNELFGKTLNEQIQLVLNSRLNDLNEELARNNEEKQRLEAGMNKGSSDVNMSNTVPQAIPKLPLTGGGTF